MQNREVKYLIPESVYDYNHPEVIFWTKFFSDRAARKNVFSNINATLAHISDRRAAAKHVAAAWYDFACYVPTFISKAVAMTSEPEWQHHLIQIAYDELGGRYKDNIHSKIFITAIESIGLSLQATASSMGIRHVLRILDQTLTNTKSQQGIIGLLLSFEIIAEQNIETLFGGLCYSPEHEEMLSKSRFFRIHRADETEHIRHSVANFLRFCQSDDDKALFQESFDAGIDYWQRFWDEMSRIVLLSVPAKPAATRNEAASVEEVV